MISISYIEANASGSVVIEEDPKSQLRDAAARVTRSGTLDGGAVIVHQGYSDGDNTFIVRGIVTEAQETVLDNMFQTQALVHISSAKGFFIGAIASLRTDNGALVMTILIESKLSE
jgi:hypothetical protein